MSFNLDSMTIPELDALIAEAQSAKARRKDADRAETLAKLKAVAAESGYSLEELMKPARAPRGSAAVEKADKRSSVEPKFAHPENASVTWTGRGKPPKWVSEYEASGKSREDLLIAR